MLRIQLCMDTVRQGSEDEGGEAERLVRPDRKGL